MRYVLFALFLTGCASTQTQTNRSTTPAATARHSSGDAGDAADLGDAARGPLHGTLERIDAPAVSSDTTSEAIVTVSLENTGATECTVSTYKLDMQLGAVANAKALCSVGRLTIAPGSKSDTQCRVRGATQVGDAPGLSIGHTAVTDIVATCK